MTPGSHAALLAEALLDAGKVPVLTAEAKGMIARAISAAVDEATSYKAGAYDACESVARKRLAHIPPDLEAEIPRLCEIEQRIWEQHRDHMPINALDMLEHAKRKRLEEALAEAVQALRRISLGGQGRNPPTVAEDAIDKLRRMGALPD